MRGVLVPAVLPVVTLVREHAFPNADAGGVSARVHRTLSGTGRRRPAVPLLSPGRPQARLGGAVRGWVFEGDLLQYGATHDQQARDIPQSP